MLREIVNVLDASRNEEKNLFLLNPQSTLLNVKKHHNNAAKGCFFIDRSRSFYFCRVLILLFLTRLVICDSLQ